MEIIQEVGSYAGFAAVVGLAVLSALYFSHARDLRRLREWAGRAPERAAEQPVPGATLGPEQAAQQAVRPAPTGAVRPIPAAKLAPAAAAGAGPATAVQPGGPQAKPPGAAPPVPATAAANAARPAPGKPVEGPAAAGAKTAVPPKPGGPTPATVPVAATVPGPATPAGTPAAGSAAPPPAPPGTPPGAPVPPVRPPLPGRPPVRPAPVSTASQPTAVLPASTRLRDTGPPARTAHKGLSPRYAALIAAGVIVLGGGAAFGISQLGGDDDKSSNADRQDGSDSQDPEAPVNPSTVTVSVLNGTTVPGLAAQIGDEVEAGGFQRGNVANAIDQQRAESVVLFAEGAEREARVVARKLKISQIEPVDPDSQALAGNASVVVIVGADRTS